ncbi:zinc finger domain-containing protein [Encephalitozoon intestinalis]|nr:zinc finger domain-containing protein [Encephalitozoon intestinalis]
MDDCYFFLYSSCKFKDRCTYRHNEKCRNNLVTCKNWESKIPCNEDCPYRHSKFHLKKNRREEMCYWEDKPRGCTKDRCEYRHTNPMKDAWKTAGLSEEAQELSLNTSGSSMSEQQGLEDIRLKDYEEVMSIQEQHTDPKADTLTGTESPKKIGQKETSCQENSTLLQERKSEATNDTEKIELHSNVLKNNSVEDVLKSQNKRVKTEETPNVTGKTTVNLEELDKEIEELDGILMD